MNLFVVHKCHTTNPTECNEVVGKENLLTAATKKASEFSCVWNERSWDGNKALSKLQGILA